MQWSPKPGLWTPHHILLHIASAREEWMQRAINDGEPGVARQHGAGKDEIKAALQQTWERIARLFRDQPRLDETYRDRWWDKAPLRSGHWVAFHLLEHDIHHRADLFLYLALLDIEVPQVWTP